MKIFRVVLGLLCVGVVSALSEPQLAHAETIYSSEQTITITAIVREHRTIIVDANGAITEISSNTDNDITPEVHFLSYAGPKSVLTLQLSHQYQYLMTQLKSNHIFVMNRQSPLINGLMPQLLLPASQPNYTVKPTNVGNLPNVPYSISSPLWSFEVGWHNSLFISLYPQYLGILIWPMIRLTFLHICGAILLNVLRLEKYRIKAAAIAPAAMVPMIIRKILIMRPAAVAGTISPYPVVVSVVIVHHNASHREWTFALWPASKLKNSTAEANISSIEEEITSSRYSWLVYFPATYAIISSRAVKVVISSNSKTKNKRTIPRPFNAWEVVVVIGIHAKSSHQWNKRNRCFDFAAENLHINSEKNNIAMPIFIWEIRARVRAEWFETSCRISSPMLINAKKSDYNIVKYCSLYGQLTFLAVYFWHLLYLTL